MTSILVMICILWILSPIVLIPLYFATKNKYERERQENNRLHEVVKTLQNKLFNSESSTDTIVNTPQQQPQPPPFIHKTSNQPVLNKTIIQDTSIPNSKPIKLQNSISAISVILVIGVVFILLAGVVFTTTTWNYLNNIIKTLLIFSVSVLFFGVGYVAERKLKLKKTGKAFYSIGCFLLPVNILAIGSFRLFGDWLSWDGDGKYLLGAIGTILLAIASGIGTKKYKSKLYAITSLLCTYCSILLILRTLSPNNVLCIILLSGYSLIVILFKDKINLTLTTIDDTYSLIFELLFTLNMVTIDIIVLCLSKMDTSIGISIIVYSIVMIFYSNRSNNSVLIHSIIGALFMTVGTFDILKLDNSLVAVTILTIAFYIISKIKFLNSGVSSNFRIFSNISIMLVATISYITALDSYNGLICIVIMIAYCTYTILKDDSKISLYFHIVFVLSLCFHLTFILTLQGIEFLQISPINYDTTLMIICCIIFIAYLVYQFSDRLRSSFSLILSIVAFLVCLSISIIIHNNFNIILSVLWILTLLLNFKKEDITFRLSMYLFPLSLILCIKSISLTFNLSGVNLITAGIISVIAVLLNFKDIKKLSKAFDIYSIILLIYYIIADYSYHRIYLTMLLAFAVFKTVLSKYRDNRTLKILYTNVSILSCIVLTLTWSDTDLTTTSLILSIILFIAYYVVKLLKVDCDILKFLKWYTVVILEISQWYICLTNGHFIISFSLTIIIMNFIFAYDFKNNILSLFSIGNFYYVVSQLVTSDLNFETYRLNEIAILITNVIFFIFMAILGRCLHKKFLITEKGTSKVYVDYFSLFAIVPIIRIFLIDYNVFNSKTIPEFIGFIMLAIYPMIFYNRLTLLNSNRILFTISNGILCFVFWTQPFFKMIDILYVEWNCIPIIVFSLILQLLWKDVPTIKEYSLYIASVIVSIVLSISAIDSQELIDAFILLICLLLILIGSFIVKRKKWFVFSTIELVLLTIYLTKEFWLSIEWWVYLLLVGLLMITIGATNEYLKIKNESLKGNIKKSTKRMFQDWNW